MHNGRPLLRPGLLAYALAFAQARADLAALNLQHQEELAELHQEIVELHQEIAELRGIVADVVTGLRQEADRDVAQLRRQLEIALVRLTKRDPAQPLQ